MSSLNNPIDILRLLPKTNCRDCGERSCLAFAVSVARGQQSLGDCLHLDSGVIEQYGETAPKKRSDLEEREEAARVLKNKLREMDLESAAERAGGEVSNGKLTLKIMGKNFSVDSHGDFSSEIHIHPCLNLFFDSTAEDNLPIESIYGLATGLVRMFEKISQTHGV